MFRNIGKILLIFRLFVKVDMISYTDSIFTEILVIFMVGA